MHSPESRLNPLGISFTPSILREGTFTPPRILSREEATKAILHDQEAVKRIRHIEEIREQLLHIPLCELGLMAYPDFEALLRFGVWPAEDLDEEHIALMEQRIAEWNRRQKKNSWRCFFSKYR